MDGGAIGLVSISRDSVHPLAWTSNLQYTNAGAKFTNKYAFTMVGVHYGTHESDFDHMGSRQRPAVTYRSLRARHVDDEEHGQ